jgi:hypothetical protein
LGKHSLGTRDAEQALANLRRLDRQMAVQRGLAPPAASGSPPSLSVRDGWELYLRHCGRDGVLGGTSPGTLKRYRAVCAKHVAY